jgi:hypothetical protein
MADLRAFARELMKDAERDLGTSLDWVAVDHWNTDNPHVHMLVRGRADGGQDLVISRDYIGHGFRSRGRSVSLWNWGRGASWKSAPDINGEFCRLEEADSVQLCTTGACPLRIRQLDGADRGLAALSSDAKIPLKPPDCGVRKYSVPKSAQMAKIYPTTCPPFASSLRNALKARLRTRAHWDSALSYRFPIAQRTEAAAPLALCGPRHAGRCTGRCTLRGS